MGQGQQKEITNTGIWSIYKGNNNVTYTQEQGEITTNDGNEKANYTFLEVGALLRKVSQQSVPLGYTAQILQGSYFS